jgi:hypothetical protein
MHGIFISAPINGRIYVAERSRKSAANIVVVARVGDAARA